MMTLKVKIMGVEQVKNKIQNLINCMESKIICPQTALKYAQIAQNDLKVVPL